MSAPAPDGNTVITNILNTEEERLREKEKYIKTAELTQERKVGFNQNERKKMEAYNLIFLRLVYAFFAVFVVLLIGRLMPSFPQTFAIIAILGSIFIVSFYGIFDIWARSPLDFDIYNLPAPDIHVVGTGETIGGGVDIIAPGSGDQPTCQGQLCCSDDTVWDPVLGLCKVPPASGFQNMNAAHPFTPSEFTTYSPFYR
jgi:hypothetical protein